MIAPTFKEIFAMKENEVILFDSGCLFVQVLRVPYGFIYTHMDKSRGIMSSCFVPFDTEINANVKIQKD